MHHRLPLLATRLFNTPLLIDAGKAQIIVSVLRDRLGVADILDPSSPATRPATPAAFGFLDDDDYTPPPPQTPYDLLQGIALIPVDGTLVHKNGTIRPYSGMTGYDGIRSAFLTAQGDPAVKAVALHIDSPGGETSGCFDLADTITAHKGAKPCWAILDECAASAAYLLASACDRIVMPRTGIAGSIGVVCVLTEMSGALAKQGVTVNIVQFGAQKADGNPFQSLAPDARARFQARVDDLGEMFVETVARNRTLTPEAVRNTQAAVFTAPEALKLGLIDAIQPPDQALSALLATL